MKKKQILNKKNKIIRKISLISITLLILLNCSGCNLFNKNNDLDNITDNSMTRAFFLKDSNSKYALFNDDGKQLTKFIYTDKSDFITNTTVVEIDDQVGIIDSKGKMTVPLGKYDSIFTEANIYKVTEIKNDDYYDYLINGDGKIIRSYDNYKILSYLSDTFIVLQERSGDHYLILNADGKELITIPKKIMDDDISISESDDQKYLSIAYDNKNWIFKLKSGEKIVSFDSEIKYCIGDITADESLITMYSCQTNNNLDGTKYITIKNGKTYDKSDECNAVRIIEGNLICENRDGKSYFLDSNFNVTSNMTYASFIDKDNYAVTNGKRDTNVQVYQKGNLVKELSCMETVYNSYNKNDVYIFKSALGNECKGDLKSGYYKLNGEKLIDKTFKDAEPFDSNDLGRVSEDKKLYYLINKKGEQIGNKYNSIGNVENYYIVRTDNLKGIMNKEGKEIISTMYSDIKIIKHYNQVYALLKGTDSKYIVYNLDENKEIINSNNVLDINNPHYIIGISNNKKQYYTYSGKMFYEN